MSSLFVTGASGFIGRRLLGRLAGRFDRITALSRTEQPPSDGVTWMRGDVRTAPYERLLGPETVVAHLAAATGAARAAEHRAVNALGTEAVVKACQRARVAGLLFVSSIAARYPEDRRYPYATAKREAEVIVRGASLPFTIVRPTIVLGAGSPILERLRLLAGGPVVAAIGGGTTRVQPVDVEDLATALARLLERRSFDGTTLEFGGPEVLTMLELLQRLRTVMGRPTGRVVSIPFGPIRGGLLALEAVLGRRVPVTARQLSAFVHDSVAQANPLWAELRPQLRTVDQMLGGADARG